LILLGEVAGLWGIGLVVRYWPKDGIHVCAPDQRIIRKCTLAMA